MCKWVHLRETANAPASKAEVKAVIARLILAQMMPEATAEIASADSAGLSALVARMSRTGRNSLEWRYRALVQWSQKNADTPAQFRLLV